MPPEAGGARIGRVVGKLPQPMTRSVSDAGESNLGDLVAMHSVRHARRYTLMNPAACAPICRRPGHLGRRADAAPFANHLVTLDMTGAQLLALLEQQWPADSSAPPGYLRRRALLQLGPGRPAGARIVEACDAAVNRSTAHAIPRRGK